MTGPTAKHCQPNPIGSAPIPLYATPEPFMVPGPKPGFGGP